MEVESSKAELSKLGTQALQDLYNNLTQVKNFALEQAPDIMQQWVHREIIGSLFLAGVGLLLIVTSWIVFFLLHNSYKKASPRGNVDNEPYVIGYILLFGAPFLVGLIILITNLYKALLVYIAPKVFLIEQIRHLL